VLLILVILALSVFGIVRLGRTLEPRQRIVLLAVYLAAIAYAIVRLIQLGLLGRYTGS
jgi:hypothetical protein